MSWDGIINEISLILDFFVKYETDKPITLNIHININNKRELNKLVELNKLKPLTKVFCSIKSY